MGILKSIKTLFEGQRNTHPEFDQIIMDSIKENRTEYYEIKVNQIPSYYDKVKNWKDAKKGAFILYCLEEIRYHESKKYEWDSKQYHTQYMLVAYVKHLFRTKINLSEENIVDVLNAFQKAKSASYVGYNTSLPTVPFFNLLIKQFKGEELPSTIQREILDFRKRINNIQDKYWGKEKLKMLSKIDELLSVGEGGSIVNAILFVGNDRLSDYANPQIEEQKEKELWYKVLKLAQQTKTSKPSKKYLGSCKVLIQEIGSQKFKDVLNDWFGFLINLKVISESKVEVYSGESYTHHEHTYITNANIDTVKGLVWMCAHFHDTKTINNIANLAIKSYKKLPGVGPTAAALGNACFYTLYKSKGLDGIGQLSRLKVKIKHSMALKTIDKYLLLSAKEKGISIQEIEDIAIDDFGLIHEVLQVPIGDFTAQITLLKPGKTELVWLKQDGKAQKSIPASVKEKFATKLANLKKKKKGIEQISSAQRDRLDNMLKLDREWNYSDFKKLFLEHGLMSFFGKRLIWKFENKGTTKEAFLWKETWVDSQGRKVEIEESSIVRIWHPAVYPTEHVLEWRTFLLNKEVQQPIKQAYREVYILTEAEINTKTYSNRMAAHILKQHQYVNLAKIRNWKATLIGAWDYGGSEIATLDIPSYNIQAQFWVQDINDDAQVNDSYIYNYVSTDQIRFVNLESGDLMDLVDIPAILFSEVLRDTDLFVGVASVGNDPTWQDGGELPQYRDYWASYSFGDLTEIAKNRKEILESLVPRLKIRDIAHIDGKFLVVKGKLRTYKIHIGSTNILMEPNDQYLCIVADRSTKSHTGKLFIPFEGDNGLSIVLSKAFLLAEDDKITDSTITSQINRG